MGLTSFPGIPNLTPLEGIGPKGYLRYVFPFRLHNDYNIEEVSQILRAGLAATKERLPVLACEAVPDPDSKRKLNYISITLPISVSTLVFADGRVSRSRGIRVFNTA